MDEINKVLEENHVNESLILSLASSLDNDKSEENVRNVVKKLAELTNREVTQDLEDKIVKAVIEK